MPVRKGRTAKGEQTRRTLLEAASRLFAARGYHNTSVPDIVREAGVGHGTFYEYFSSRRAILIDLTQQEVGLDSRLPRLRATSRTPRSASGLAPPAPSRPRPTTGSCPGPALRRHPPPPTPRAPPPGVAPPPSRGPQGGSRRRGLPPRHRPRDRRRRP